MVGDTDAETGNGGADINDDCDAVGAATVFETDGGSIKLVIDGDALARLTNLGVGDTAGMLLAL